MSRRRVDTDIGQAAAAAGTLPSDLTCTEDFLAFCGRFAIPLFDWQRSAFGGATKRRDGRFIHRLAGVSVPRGDGKSYAAAAVGVWRLVMGPPPQLILSEALDIEGAKVTLHHARSLVKRHPDLAATVEILTEELRTSTGSRWLIRSRDHESSRGLHPDVTLYDETGGRRMTSCSPASSPVKPPASIP
jgi:phage terminase large subunit-like protein